MSLLSKRTDMWTAGLAFCGTRRVMQATIGLSHSVMPRPFCRYLAAAQLLVKEWCQTLDEA